MFERSLYVVMEMLYHCVADVDTKVFAFVVPVEFGVPVGICVDVFAS